MRKCLEVNHRDRPTFEDLVPIFETNTSDIHKQVLLYFRT